MKMMEVGQKARPGIPFLSAQEVAHLRIRRTSLLKPAGLADCSQKFPRGELCLSF